MQGEWAGFRVQGSAFGCQDRAEFGYQYPKQGAFGEEFIARSGGLGNWAVAADPQRTTSNDIVLCTARSWEKDAAELQAQLAEFRKQGWLIIVFASRQGAPQDLPCDHFIDTGPATGNAAEGPINIIANETAGWMWTCEFVAALTRHGKHPGVFMSAFYQGEEKHNQPLAQKATLFDCPTPVAAGKLAKLYLDRVQRLVTELGSDQTRAQVERAAAVVATRIAAGGRVGVASCDHTLPYELFQDVRTPFIPFHVDGRGQQAWDDALRPGELVVWFSYIGMATKYEAYDEFMRNRGLDVVSCFVPDPEPKKNLLPPALPAAAVPPGQLLAHIDQHWQIGDAEVPLPFPPGKMAPASGIDQVLVFRMLDAAIAARLAGGRGKTTTQQPGRQSAP